MNLNKVQIYLHGLPDDKIRKMYKHKKLIKDISIYNRIVFEMMLRV